MNLKALLMLACLFAPLPAAATPLTDELCSKVAEMASGMVTVRDLGLTRADYQVTVLDTMSARANPEMSTLLDGIADFVWDNPDHGFFLAMPVAYGRCVEVYEK